jgi:hypothetical protein
VFYLLTLLLTQRNFPYTNTLPNIQVTMKQPLNISILTFVFCLFFFNSIAQSNRISKCDISIVLETSDGMDNLSEDLVLRFLQTFGKECKNNAEFSEFSNDILFKVIQQNAEMFCNTLESNEKQIELNEIIENLKNPINDSIDLELSINNIANTKVKPETKSKLIIAINSGNWNESKKIEKLKDSTIMFFQPDSTEFNAILNSKDSEGINEVSSDFEFYAYRIINFYKDSGFNVSISDKRFFIVNDSLIDKLGQESSYGIIFVKNKEYKIETGVFTDVGIGEIITDYYKKE